MNQNIKNVLINMVLNLFFACMYPLVFMFIYLTNSGDWIFSVRIWLISYIGSMIVYRIANGFQTGFNKADNWFMIMGVFFYAVSIIFNSIENVLNIQYRSSLILLLAFSVIISLYILFIDLLQEYLSNKSKIREDKKQVERIRKSGGNER